MLAGVFYGAQYGGSATAILAFDDARMSGQAPEVAQQRAEALFGSIERQGARPPSQRRFAARQRSAAQGIRVSLSLIEDIDRAFAPCG